MVKNKRLGANSRNRNKQRKFAPRVVDLVQQEET